jgi:hypothetical protein
VEATMSGLDTSQDVTDEASLHAKKFHVQHREQAEAEAEAEAEDKDKGLDAVPDEKDIATIKE